ncbi:casein kinase i-like protein [Anaeramoeba flamelloides]|uniref:non-specific serine/threonine protein kinase n=1 Tax=Anaeramoeba flamelloides TaxID=1746091 RepID=A0AAV7ZIA6_9EUKA|nr:casein kinase i-like protein [Anaeramoeba flamelloides]
MGNKKNKLFFPENSESESENSNQIPQESLLLNGKYQIQKKIGRGSFGKIHLCCRVSDNEIFAVKFETESQEGQLEYEYKLYQISKGHCGFPNVYSFGQENYRHFLIMDLLGPNLESLFKYCDRKFSLKTVLMIADQILCRLEQVHSKSFVYRDIKPENFVIGRENQKNQIFIIDFGLSKLYRDFWTHKSNRYRNKRDLVGTVRYSSINTHLGIEQSRRDDLESLGYMLIYFLRGRLPWQGMIASNNKERNEKICDKKVVTPLRVLCDGIPIEFQQYLDYCKNLSYEDQPNYGLLRYKFRKLFLSKNYLYDYEYDWKIKHDEESRIKRRNSTDRESFHEKESENDLFREKDQRGILQTNIFIPITNKNKGNNNKNKGENINSNNNKKQKKKKKKIKGIVLIEDSESDSESENEIQSEKEIKEQLIKKINEFEERIQFYQKKEDKKLKLKIEHILLKQQELPEVTETEKEQHSRHLLRLGEIYSLKRREIYQSIREIDEILKNNPNFNDEKIEELSTYIKMELNRSLSFYSLILLDNDLNNLLYLLNEKKTAYESGWEIDSNGKIKIKNKKNKKFEYKNYLNERTIKKKKMVQEKFSLIEQVSHSKEVKEDEKIQKLFLKLVPLKSKNLSSKKLDSLCDDLNKLIILIQEKFQKD